MSVFKDEWVNEAKALYPTWTDLHKAIEDCDQIIGRYLYDASCNEVGYEDILGATNLDELKHKVEINKRKDQLYEDYITGRCYINETIRREKFGCPRLYALNARDGDACEAFPCYGVYGFIPDCKKYKTGECWKKFDELGLKMK